MKKIIVGMLALLMLFSVPFAVGAASLSTEQKYEVLRQQSIFSGFADGSSRLYDSMSREQLATVLFRLLELPERSSSPSYSDVLKTRWSYHEVEAVTRAGLMVGTHSRIFSPKDSVTVEQLAAVFIRSYGLSGSGVTPVTGKVSKWAKGVVSLALDNKLIPQLSDYRVEASRALLVEAAYAVYEDTHIEPLKVRSVEPLSNQSVKVNLLQWTNQADKSRFSLKDNFGSNRNILQATLSQDGMSVILLTDWQAGNVTHTLTVDGISWNYVLDSTKPQVLSLVSLPNRIVEITFNEPVDNNSATNSANYQFNNGLKLTKLQLSPDQRKVSITTTEQAEGKTYQLTIRNVKDFAGNVMDTRNNLTFNSGDITKPRVTSVKVNPNATLTIKFSEKINAAHAVLTDRYGIDKGLAVIQAILENDGLTVTLKTSSQKDATLYNLTVANIPDLAGNVMDVSSNWKFGGIANPETPVLFQNVQAIDRNTVEVTFNRALTDSDVKNLKLAILTDNGSGVSMSDWQAYVQRQAGSDRTVTVQFRNKASNPDLFRAGHVYVARVTGVAGLQTSNDADRLPFAGTELSNRDPYVTQAIVINRKSIKVLFSEPVTNVNETAFRLQEKDGGSVRIAYDELNNTGKVVNEVILILDDELQANKTYILTFQPGIITDAAKWNGLKTMEGSQPFAVYFTVS
ncbi:Ig-like domain-containing protein [Cohnella sp.]|uniref:Ig-like domain-containing protein n=1 Tax=Cohnella sp. TaxID=1883426 RepID=UPI003565708D